VSETPAPGGDATVGEIAIRPSRDTDLPAIHAIYRHHVLTGLASFETEPPDAGTLAERRAAILERGLPYLVAELHGKIAGFAYCGPYRPRPAYRFTVENSVYVAPEWQRRGVAKALMTRLIEAATEAGCRQMVAVIGDSGNEASVELHRRFGFRHIGTLASVGFKFGRWVDTVIMQRRLGPGGNTPPEA
jgi:phosphinothricin acetyltransferase